MWDDPMRGKLLIRECFFSSVYVCFTLHCLQAINQAHFSEKHPKGNVAHPAKWNSLYFLKKIQNLVNRSSRNWWKTLWVDLKSITIRQEGYNLGENLFMGPHLLKILCTGKTIGSRPYSFLKCPLKSWKWPQISEVKITESVYWSTEERISWSRLYFSCTKSYVSWISIIVFPFTEEIGNAPVR